MADIEIIPHRTIDEITLKENTVKDAEKCLAPGQDRDQSDGIFLVTFDADDPENPKNWSNRMKWGVTAALSATGFNRIMVSTVRLNDLQCWASRRYTNILLCR